MLKTSSIGVLWFALASVLASIFGLLLWQQWAMVSCSLFFASLSGVNAEVLLISKFQQRKALSLASVIGANGCIAFLGVSFWGGFLSPL